jgi:hypothetical protein
MAEAVVLLWQQEIDQEQSAPEALRNMGLSYFQRMMSHPHELRLQFQAISEVDGNKIARQLRQDHQNYVRFIEIVLRKGIRQCTMGRDEDVAAMGSPFDGIGILMNGTTLLSFERSLGGDRGDEIMDDVICSPQG